MDKQEKEEARKVYCKLKVLVSLDVNDCLFL